MQLTASGAGASYSPFKTPWVTVLEVLQAVMLQQTRQTHRRYVWVDL